MDTTKHHAFKPKKDTTGKISGCAVHHCCVTLGDERPASPVTIFYIVLVHSCGVQIVCQAMHNMPYLGLTKHLGAPSTFII